MSATELSENVKLALAFGALAVPVVIYVMVGFEPAVVTALGILVAQNTGGT